MPTLVETVLALSPVFFGVLYDALGSTVINDLSGNGNHGTYDAAAIFGLPSAIETDPASSSIGNVVGSIPAADGSQMDLRGNQTWIGFAYYDEVLASTAHLLGRTQQFGQSNGVLSGFNGGVISSHITLDDGSPLGAFYPLTDPVAPAHGNFYMISSVRNDTVFSLFTNERLAATRSDLSSDPVHLLGGSNLPWWIGRSGGSGAFPGIRTCAIIFFDYALNSTQLGEIHASAINRLLMRAYSNVLPSAVWRTAPDAIPMQYPLRHNFEDTLIERISFLTNNSKTLGGSTEGSEMRPKPRREIEIHNLLRTDEERRTLRAKLWAHQHGTWFIPIRQDFHQLSSTLSSGVQTIPTPTQYKDYEVNSWVGLRQVDDVGRIVKSEILQIDAVNAEDVQTKTATVNSYDAMLSFVYPVRRGIIRRSIPVRGHTDSVEDLVLVAELLSQDEAEIPNRITQWTPTIVYKGYEAHDPEVWQSHNWEDGREYEIERALSRIDFQTGIFEVESDTPGAEEAFEYRMLLKGRDKIAQFLGWFYARGGSLTYLWVPSMQKDFNILGTGVPASSLVVSGTNYSENFALAEARRDLAFVYQDNTMLIGRVTGFSGSPDETLVISPLHSTVNLRSLSLLKFCQMESDTVELAWVTDDLVQVAWRFKELLSTPT